MQQVRIVRLAVAITFVAFGSFSPAWSQCQSWSTRFGPGGPNRAVRALASFDDGSGPALFVGGDFSAIGDMPARAIARWNGATWSVPDGGVTSSTGNLVNALLVFDDGSGPALFAGGAFDEIGDVSALNVARWDGTAWSPLGGGIGSNDEVSALVAFDDGGGPALYAAVGPWPDCTASVWKWNGASWSQVGAAPQCQTFALAVFDDGGGPALYAGGAIAMPNGQHVANVSRWNGATWSAVGTGLPNGGFGWSAVFALASGDDGNGPGLFASGDFQTAGGSVAEGVAKWNGTSWSPLASSTFDNFGGVYALTFFDDGSGTALFAGGIFSVPGGQGIGKWNGSSWSAPGGGLGGGAVGAFAPFDDGSGLALHVGGDFPSAGGARTPGLASWDGSAWHTYPGEPGGTNNDVIALHSSTVGGAPKLYAGGAFTQAGHAPASRIASWDGYGWQPLGSGTDGNVTTLASFDDGGGLDLYAGGTFTSAGGAPANRIARWDGVTWSTLGSGVNDIVRALAVYDDGSGPALYVAGHFTMAGGAPANRLAKWNGSSWSPLGSGTDNWVLCLAVFDDGSGPALYAGGVFDNAGGTPADGVARWDGSSWSAVGNPGSAGSLVVFDDGSGPALYRATSQSVSGHSVSRWNGASWIGIGVPNSGVVQCLRVHDDGRGPALIAAGRFAGINGVSAAGVARWDGAAWTSLGGGLNLQNSDSVYAIAVHDDSREGGPDLYLGGMFDRTWDSGTSENVAEWYGCARPGTLFCFGDGSVAPCPCGNNGPGARGCQNSAGTGGARLTTSGHLNPDTVVLHVSDELPSALTIFLQGNVRVGPLAFGDGLRCAGGALKRLYTKNASNGSASVPGGGDPSITARSATLGDVIAPGTKRYYHTYYRDPNPTFCPSPPGSTFNSSNGIEILW